MRSILCCAAGRLASLRLSFRHSPLGRFKLPKINKTLKRLSQILELAVDYGYLSRNPAASKGSADGSRSHRPGAHG
jgi:hypothetical protein